MSNIDKRALREAAEKATESDWIVDAHEGWHAVIPVADAVNGNYIIAEFQGPESKRNRDFVAAANPATVLALLDELEEAEKRIAELSGEFFALPPLNDDLITILGRPNFTCAHLAELLRKGGQDIRRKAEHEQASVIYWFLDLYLKYGEKWESIAKDDIRARAAMITAGTAKGE
ncbi:ead/Ea22-like family protein [Enterobacter vonholyi]|uniref:ead/Ea22-like family protein n=1 Tax=Enterobacter vonholyi TaxID=2797505 RepID=UPI0026661892|nr:ead/Ea22-like family protein [Enterobacter vonholyi]MDO2449734.1 ead/Ea22-like family protein [Enterobacter vonholyi]